MSVSNTRRLNLDLFIVSWRRMQISVGMLRAKAPNMFHKHGALNEVEELVVYNPRTEGVARFKYSGIIRDDEEKIVAWVLTPINQSRATHPKLRTRDVELHITND